MPSLYILECADGSYYTGSTWDLPRRLAEHAAGQGARYTARRLLVTLVYAESFDRIDEAFRREKQVQGWSRRKKQALIAGAYEDLPALAASAPVAVPDPQGRRSQPVEGTGGRAQPTGGFDKLSHRRLSHRASTALRSDV